MDSVEIRPDAESFRRLARALDDEADGREWRREFNAAMREALAPGVAAVRSALVARSGGGLPHAGEPLRQAISAGVKVVELRSGTPGAKIRASKSGLPRQFSNAPKRFNASSFRHPAWGNRDHWVSQIGAPGWFDDPLRQLRPELTARAERVLHERADRISRRAP